jgi:hypothetical protein
MDTNAAPPLSPELAATGACVTALEDLPADAQLRVLAFLSGRFSSQLIGRGVRCRCIDGAHHGLGVRRVIGQVVADNRPA